MKDIIPSQGFRDSASSDKDHTRRGMSQHVVKVDWKLPSRFTKPIRQQLALQREMRQRRESVVRFERRPVRTTLPSERPPDFADASRIAKGAEYHTGDVYMHSRPKRGLNSPPYHGPGARGAKKVIRPPRSKHMTLRGESSSTPTMRGVDESMSLPVSVYEGERDVPYDFPHQEIHLPREDGFGGILEPQRWKPSLLSFFSFSWSLSWWGRRPQRLALNLALLLVGCFLVYGLVWKLDGVAQSFAALTDVKGRVLAAYQNVTQAQSALAEADFAASEQRFLQAEQMLREAQGELEVAVDSSRAVVTYGDRFLTAGEKLAQAGGHVSRGMELLLTQEGQSLTDGLERSQSEFHEATSSLAEAEDLLSGPTIALLPSDVREQVVTMREQAIHIRSVLEGFADTSDVLLSLLGADREHQYLLAFQNNHEIRPTGGFVGSVGLVDVDRGQVENIDITSVYDPDGQLKELMVPPEPLRLVTDRWYLRDANWFIDFPTSARLMTTFFEKEGGPTVDGVIAFTPELVRSLLKVTGPIEISQYAVTVSYENFWEVTQDQVSYSYDKQLNKPKQFLADLAPLILDRLFSLPADKSLSVVDVLSDMLKQKHLLMYFRDMDVQELLVERGLDGSVPRNKQGMLAVNNANIAGHKTDQFVDQEIDYRMVMLEDGDVEAEVLIRRTHNGPAEVGDYPYPPQEDPSLKDNIVYQRVLVPAGAELVGVQGFSDPSTLPKLIEDQEVEAQMNVNRELAEWQRSQSRHPSGTTIGEEAGYTSFANWMVTKPGTTSVALYRYRLPRHADSLGLFDQSGSLQAFIVKQPGDVRSVVRVSIELPEKLRIVRAVPDEGITQDEPGTVVYRSRLDRDRVVGVVFEHE